MSPRHARSPWLLVYRALLRLYPGPVRKRFGPDMAECFDDLRRTTRRDRGRAAELGLVVRTFGELPRSALRAHRERLFGSPGKQPLDPPLLRSHRGSRIAMDTIMQDIRFGLRSFLGLVSRGESGCHQEEKHDQKTGCKPKPRTIPHRFSVKLRTDQSHCSCSFHLS